MLETIKELARRAGEIILRAETEETLDRIFAALEERGYVVSFP